MSKTYTLDIRWTGTAYAVTIPELGATASGATYQEAIENGQRAITAARLKALQAAKELRQAKHQTVA